MINSNGKVLDPEGFRQPVIFEGIRIGKTGTPTDIDMAFDVGPDKFVFCEVKHKGAVFGGGQKLHLQRVCDAIAAGGGTAIAVLATHDTKKKSDSVMAAGCDVALLYIEGKWRTPKKPTTLVEFTDEITRRWGR